MSNGFFIGRLCNYLGLWYIKYINESQVGNGNSISSISKDGEKTESIFTDIFWTSIGNVSGNGYSAIDKTGFRADTYDKLSFFTDKSYVEGLVCAF